MTRLQVTLDLPDRLAREAEDAGLLAPSALRDLLEEAMRQRAAQVLLDAASRVSDSGLEPLSMAEIQAEVAAVRRERRRMADPG